MMEKPIMKIVATPRKERFSLCPLSEARSGSSDDQPNIFGDTTGSKNAVSDTPRKPSPPSDPDDMKPPIVQKTNKRMENTKSNCLNEEAITLFLGLLDCTIRRKIFAAKNAKTIEKMYT